MQSEEMKKWIGKKIRRVKPLNEDHSYIGYDEVVILTALTDDGIYVNPPQYRQSYLSQFLGKEWLDGNWRLAQIV